MLRNLIWCVVLPFIARVNANRFKKAQVSSSGQRRRSLLQMLLMLRRVTYMSCFVYSIRSWRKIRVDSGKGSDDWVHLVIPYIRGVTCSRMHSSKKFFWFFFLRRPYASPSYFLYMHLMSREEFNILESWNWFIMGCYGVISCTSTFRNGEYRPIKQKQWEFLWLYFERHPVSPSQILQWYNKCIYSHIYTQRKLINTNPKEEELCH